MKARTGGSLMVLLLALGLTVSGVGQEVPGARAEWHIVDKNAAKGNGTIIPALVPQQAFGFDPDLPPYPFEPSRARQLLHDAGYPQGLTVRLIASKNLTTQATVIGKMLEQAGFTVTR